MTRLAWLRAAGRQNFFVFNKYNFLEKLAREILEKIMEKYQTKNYHAHHPFLP
jgi:dihydroneopterin aldolase